MTPVNLNQVIGSHDVLFIVLDTLRYDTAKRALDAGATPNIARYLANEGWDQRHSPATFTYPAHHAFFSGFLPTPIAAGNHPRLFAPDFIGSESTFDTTWLFQEANVVEALANRHYHTVCIGGVGFFNKQNAIGSIFPNLFQESHWNESTSVACKTSTEHQVNIAIKALQRLDNDQRCFTFINISALHQPNHFYIEGEQEDSVETQIAALAYVDSQIGQLFEAMKNRADTFCILCSDHGTCYGEDGYRGHKLVHDVVLNVPYSHFFL